MRCRQSGEPPPSPGDLGDVQGAVLSSSMPLPTAYSPRLMDGFQCFLVQNEAAVLLVSFLHSTVPCVHLARAKTSSEAKKSGFAKYFSSFALVEFW